jgi:hypothetical protein
MFTIIIHHIMTIQPFCRIFATSNGYQTHDEAGVNGYPATGRTTVCHRIGDGPPAQRGCVEFRYPIYNMLSKQLSMHT